MSSLKDYLFFTFFNKIFFGRFGIFVTFGYWKIRILKKY